MADTIAILGAGSWGTAVAIHLARAGYPVFLWAHNLDHVREMQQERCNTRYLPETPFPTLLTPVDHLNPYVQEADLVIMAIPSHAFAEVLKKITPPNQGLAWLTKGIDPSSHDFLSTLVHHNWGHTYPTAMISGPSFAKEVAAALPTALTVASTYPVLQKKIQKMFHHENLRIYLSSDLIGLQICGAVKNVLAIACGISDGLGYGSNAKAALITRGLAEMQRLGLALGAQKETFLGLAGVGDLVLTCTDNQSRNRRFGLLLGQGSNIERAEQSIHQVVEGKYNALQVCQLALQHHVEMPICQQVHELLQAKITPQQAVNNLMKRDAKKE